MKGTRVMFLRKAPHGKKVYEKNPQWVKETKKTLKLNNHLPRSPPQRVLHVNKEVMPPLPSSYHLQGHFERLQLREVD